VDDHQRNRVRLAESRQQMLALDADLARWLTRRRADDQRHQYHTQLGAIETLVQSALEELSQKLSTLSVERSPGELYDECRAFDLRVLWLRRVWEFFREKFDQRDDSRLGPVLRAADEVVWSCHRPPFLAAQVERPEVEPGPAPLPYIAPSDSPEFFPRESVPSVLRGGGVDLSFLNDHLKVLPLPLVQIPPICATSPWWLVYLAHELGHHVQARLLPDRALEDEFADHLGNFVLSRTQSPEAEALWRTWSREIFADLYSVLMAGTWALWAMVELEMSNSRAMRVGRATYPSPLVRLHLMAQVARTLKLNTDGLRGLDLEALAKGDAAVQKELDLAKEVAQDLAKLTVGGKLLRTLSGFRADDFEIRVPEWSDQLRRAVEPEAEEFLESARLVVAGAVAAWSHVSAEPSTEEALSTNRERLARRTLALIAQSREPGTRDAPQTVDASELGKSLAGALIGHTVPEGGL
jgi:hypothetical protein